LIIPKRVNADLPANIIQNDLESIVNWFEKHQRSLYVLGWSYLGNEQQLEELYYQSILKVQMDLPKVKNKLSFEACVTAIFIHKCREFAAAKSSNISQEGGQHDELFQTLRQLNGQEREALIFTYIKGLSIEETASRLQISQEQMKDLLADGIQSLREKQSSGENFNGCPEYQRLYLDYLERNLERPVKIEFEKHVYHCPNCQEDLASFQEVILQFTETLEEFQVPAGFMEGIKGRIADAEKRRQQKIGKRNRIAFIAASVFVLVMCTGFFTGAFADAYYKWTEEDPELRAFLKAELGERLNLEAESNGVKIKIKSVVADEFQTLIFYEIEDTEDNKQYVINYGDGLSVENEREILSNEIYPQYQPPDPDSELNKKKQNVFHGKISLPPLKEDSKTLNLEISKLARIAGDSSPPADISYDESSDYEKRGDWNIKVPVTKLPSTEYPMEEKINIEGIPVQLEKLIIAPTSTVLQYVIKNEQEEKRIDMIDFIRLEMNGEKLKLNPYGGGYATGSWESFQSYFEPVFETETNEVEIHFNRAYLSINDYKTIALDASNTYPQTFEYAGSTIKIEELDIGRPTTVVISNNEIKNRAYESLHFNIMTEEGDNQSMTMSSEGVFVDKNGEEYDMKKITNSIYLELENPRHYITYEKIEIPGDNVVPKRLEIYGYSTTRNLDNIIKVKLDK
jgi:DNA-directed RNA polymerase specialized sigma24 family protein